MKSSIKLFWASRKVFKDVFNRPKDSIDYWIGSDKLISSSEFTASVDAVYIDYSYN